ncbi:MAG: hypothetical protein IJ588_09320 [Prevotella sp.]|nr:hypothetical protein [Prevotella sp.]
MNRLRLKRHLAARVLLTVFLSTLALSALHQHEPCDASHDLCEACVQHVSHFEQMAVTHFPMHDCVLCQFAGTNYLPGQAVVQEPLTVSCLDLLPPVAVWLSSGAEGVCLGRAPPRCF